jgi:ABC-type Fe3+ transport system permease subunit
MLAMAPAVIPPTYLALGVLGLPRSLSLLGWPWLAWFWSALVPGAAFIAVTMAWTLDRLDPDREAAAHLAGAGPYRTWWVVTWPLIRPAIAAAVGVLLLTTLADPGPPLLLRLRRTLGFQIVASAMRPDPFPRIAALGLMVASLGLAARSATRWWAGPVRSPADRRNPPTRTARQVTWPRAAASGLVIGLWAILAWLPLAGLGRLALARELFAENSDFRALSGAQGLLDRLGDGGSLQIITCTILLGLGVAIVSSVLSRWPPGLSVPRARPGWWSGLVLLATSIPPIALGAGILAIPRMAVDLSGLSASGSAWALAGTIQELAGGVLDHPVLPGFWLLLAVCVTFLAPRMLKPAGRSEFENLTGRRVDQAV